MFFSLAPRATRLGLAVTALLAGPLAGAAGMSHAQSPSPWTQVPTKVDPDTQLLERIAPLDRADDRIYVYADRPIRLAPDNSFSAEGRRIRIFGITLPPYQKLCETAGGARWSCGGRANAYYRMLLSGRLLACRRRSPPEETLIQADCAVAERDIATTMLREGWATTDIVATDAQKALEAEAKSAHRGLWQERMPEF